MKTPPATEQMNLWNIVENRVDNGSGMKRSGLRPWVEMVASSSKSLRDHSYVEENDGLMCFREQSFITSERRERVSLLIPQPRGRPKFTCYRAAAARRRNIALRGAAASIGESHDRTSDVGNGSGTPCIVRFLRFVMVALIGMVFVG